MLRRSVLCVSLLGLACAATGPEDREPAELQRNERRWRNARPPSYVFTLERVCFCGAEARGPVRVRVDGASVTERIYVATGAVVPAARSDAFPAVEGLFDLLRSAYEAGAHRVDVTYDPDLGFPTDFFIDYQERVADDELGVRVTEAVEAI